MNLTAENTRADNGSAIHSCVSLDIEDVGHVDRPFYVVVTVSGSRLYQSFTRTRTEAEKARAKMHAAYMEVHSQSSRN